jgi:hypothetical protein
MNGAPGMRTPGICAEVAQPSLIRQCARKGSVITSRRKPRPGMIALNAVGWAMMSVNSISSMSPGCAPLTNTGPVSGCTAPASSVARSATVVVGVIWPSSASRVSSAISSPSPISTTGAMSGW